MNVVLVSNALYFAPPIYASVTLFTPSVVVATESVYVPLLSVLAEYFLPLIVTLTILLLIALPFLSVNLPVIVTFSPRVTSLIGSAVIITSCVPALNVVS